mmetsp:Transcript_17844/g.26301  ORF Transcript_17844/g.26301 Transcript_17844/m.26301 type:complete len:90 (-) Transcript_17844:27-296(-)
MPPAHSSFSSSTCTALAAVSFEDFCQYLAHIPQLRMSFMSFIDSLVNLRPMLNAHSSIQNLIRAPINEYGAPINVAYSCLAIQGREGHY